jgi:hypothetical protein
MLILVIYLKRRYEAKAIDPIVNPFVLAFVVLLIMLNKSIISLIFFGYCHNDNSFWFGVKHHLWEKHIVNYEKMMIVRKIPKVGPIVKSYNSKGFIVR